MELVFQQNDLGRMMYMYIDRWWRPQQSTTSNSTSLATPSGFVSVKEQWKNIIENINLSLRPFVKFILSFVFTNGKTDDKYTQV